MVEYDINIEDRILSYLDGWSTENPKKEMNPIYYWKRTN